MIYDNLKHGCKEIKKKSLAIQSNLCWRKGILILVKDILMNQLCIKISAQAFPFIIASNWVKW